MASESEAAVRWLETEPITRLKRRFHAPSTQPFMQIKYDHGFGTWQQCSTCRYARDRYQLIVADDNGELTNAE